MASSGGSLVLSQQRDTNINQLNSRCQNGAHECPYCVFERLEVPVVPDSVKRLVSTNDPPDENILPSLLASLNTALSVSTSVDKCIDAVQAILEQMKSAKDTCTLSIQQHRAAIRPIRSIPDDVLRTIFDWHLISELGMRAAAGDVISSSFSPWTLSHVSRSWRALVISSPRLWSTIHIVPHHIRSEHPLASKLDLVLRRSAGCDLTIHLVDNPRFRNGSMARYIALMLPMTRRWRFLQLLASDSLIAPLRTCSFDSLVELVWPLSFHSDAQTGSMFKNARNLRRLTLHGEGNIDIAWERITTFSTDVDGISNLSKLTVVESLSLHLFLHDTETEKWRTFQAKMSTSLSLPSVRSLSMTQADGPYPVCYHASQLLHIPSLTTLSIRSGKSPLPTFPGDLPHLRHITLSSSTPPAEINAFLARHPSVTSLYTVNLTVLQLLPLRPDILPNLTILRIDGKAFMSDPLHVIEVLEDRCENKLVELRISRKETAMENARDVISRVKGLLERWEVVCAKLRIVDADGITGSEFSNVSDK